MAHGLLQRPRGRRITSAAFPDENVNEALAGSSRHLRFGIAFCEASGDRLVRRSGNDHELVTMATEHALALRAGHAFAGLPRESFPLNVLNQLKLVPEVCRIFCATANPLEVVIGETEAGSGNLAGERPRRGAPRGDHAAPHRVLIDASALASTETGVRGLSKGRGVVEGERDRGH